VRFFGAVLVAALLPMSAAAQSTGSGRCRCGPAPMYPTWTCADGRHQGGRGPCTQRQDGTCSWIRLVCPEDRPPRGAPAACGPDECGAPPGSCGFDACKRDREGRCGWVQPCDGPGQGTSFAPPPPPRPRPPPPEPVVAPTKRSCTNLPRTEELRTWPVVGVCRPGGGPAPAPIARVRSLGDSTYIFSGRGGCFRGRYVRCFSK